MSTVAGRAPPTGTSRRNVTCDRTSGFCSPGCSRPHSPGSCRSAGRKSSLPGAPQPPGKEKEKEKEKRDQKPPEEDNIPYTFPYDRDAKNQLTAAREYLTFKEIPWGTVVPLLQNILEGKNDSLFNTYFVVNGEKKINRISVKTEANRIIAAFPKEGLEFYQQSYGATASVDARRRDPPKGNYDLAAITDLSQKYFHTKAGAEATILLGTLYLERGNYLEAAYAFERFLTRPNIDDSSRRGRCSRRAWRSSGAATPGTPSCSRHTWNRCGRRPSATAWRSAGGLTPSSNSAPRSTGRSTSCA